MRICNNCGKSFNEDGKFCPSCGAKASDSTSDNFYVKEEKVKKKSKKLPFIIISAVLVVVVGIIGAFLVFFKDPLLYSYHYKKGMNEAAATAKLTHYNKALRYEQNEEVLKDIFNVLKDDSDFEKSVNSLSNLSNKYKSKLITNICLDKADFYVENEEYSSAFDMLKVAQKYDYDIKKYSNYEKINDYLVEKEEKEREKENQKEVIINYRLPANIYTYSDDYIIYDSSYSYLTEYDLRGYTKEALALIRNEIYARHGYVFQTEPFKSYFNSKYWYTPNYYFSEYDLNSYERHNIDLILKMEKS